MKSKLVSTVFFMLAATLSFGQQQVVRNHLWTQTALRAKNGDGCQPTSLGQFGKAFLARCGTGSTVQYALFVQRPDGSYDKLVRNGDPVLGNSVVGYFQSNGYYLAMNFVVTEDYVYFNTIFPPSAPSPGTRPATSYRMAWRYQLSSEKLEPELIYKPGDSITVVAGDNYYLSGQIGVFDGPWPGKGGRETIFLEGKVNRISKQGIYERDPKSGALTELVPTPAMNVGIGSPRINADDLLTYAMMETVGGNSIFSLVAFDPKAKISTTVVKTGQTVEGKPAGICCTRTFNESFGELVKFDTRFATVKNGALGKAVDTATVSPGYFGGGPADYMGDQVIFGSALTGKQYGSLFVWDAKSEKTDMLAASQEDSFNGHLFGSVNTAVTRFLAPGTALLAISDLNLSIERWVLAQRPIILNAPAKVKAGESIKLTGNNFAIANTTTNVLVNGAPVVVDNLTNTEIVFKSPQSGKISVVIQEVHPTGTVVSDPVEIEVMEETANPTASIRPLVTQVADAFTGDLLKVGGWGFALGSYLGSQTVASDPDPVEGLGGTEVWIQADNGEWYPAKLQYTSDSQLTFVVPPDIPTGTRSGNLTVKTANGFSDLVNIQFAAQDPVSSSQTKVRR